MIAARTTGNGGFVLEGDVGSAAAAYVDADWVVGGGPIPALVAEGATLRFADDETATQESPATAAAAALAAVARRCVDALPADAAPVAVLGRGAIAAHARALIGRRTDEPRTRPAASIVTSSQAERLRAALREVADLGTVVAASELAADSLSLDLYRDIHRRGLRFVGVAPPLAGAGARSDGGASLPAPAEVRFGDVLPPAAWYCVRGRR